MNPKDFSPWGDSSYDDMREELEAKEREIQRVKNEIMMEKVREGRLKTEAANAAYNDLCDVLGVKDLGGSIEGGATHLRIPVSSIATIVSRIEALRSNAVAEGAEVIAEGVL